MSKTLPTLVNTRIITRSNQPQLEDLKQGALLLIDKPLKWTSFDIVNKLRSSIKYSCGIKKIKVGHAGTLDPMASGLLIVCVGKYTKIIDHLINHSKTYVASLKFGATTPSYDSELPEENIQMLDPLPLSEIERILPKFEGSILQIPPIYSAIKINGRPAHKVARKGQELEMKPRPVNIYSLKLNTYAYPYLDLHINCSKGTYIRSLAHDIGQATSHGAYLAGLRRTAIDQYIVEDALSIDEAVEWIDALPQQILD